MNPIPSRSRPLPERVALARQRFPAPLAAALLLSVAACGGGGGDESSGTTSTRITEQNAMAVVSDAYLASNMLHDNGNDAAQMSLDLKGASPQRKGSMVDLALQRLEYLGGGAGTSRYVKAVSTDSSGCEGGGSITMTIDDADNSGDASTGDSVQFGFVNCRSEGWVLNGGMSLTGLVMTGSPSDPARSLGATFTFHSFSGSDGSMIERVDGGFSIHASLQTYPARIVESTVAGSSLRVSSGGSSSELRNFALEARSMVSAGTYSYGIGAIAVDSGGAVTISNPEQFSGAIGAFPSRGSLLVRESGGSAARLTATSSTSVRIDVDANGDGVFESSMTKTWGEIAGF
jgi:hypothetical protein